MSKLVLSLVLIALLPILSIAQEKEYITIGVSGGIDQNINAYRIDSNKYGNSFSSSGTPFNIGIDFSIMATDKIRPRIEFKYMEAFYDASWKNNLIYYKGSPITKSKAKFYNFGINLHVDYLLLDMNKFKMFVSPGLKWELNVGNECRNDYANGTYDYKNYHEINTENPENIMGGSLGVLFKYKVAKNIGITLTPEYSIFFRDFVRANDAAYQRFSGNIGLEFNF